jgi:hypothetical protein
MNRDEAIAWLRSVGRNAGARDWVMGETIFVTIGEPTPGEIPVYPGAVCLYPTTAGAWELCDFGRHDPPLAYSNLESAVHGAHDYVARRERDLGAKRE